MDETTSIITETISLSGASGSPGSMAHLVSLPQMMMTSPVTSSDASGGATGSQNSQNQQQQQQQLKKLYFKPSSTESLHSAILLKARNPNNIINNNNNASSSSSAVASMPALNAAINWKQAASGSNINSENNANSSSISNNSSNANKMLYPKLANVNNLLSISSSYNTNSTNIILTNPSSEGQSSNQTASGITTTNNNNNNNNFYGDELDSPLKIKENIMASILNLKPVLAGFDLRSSTSDDEDSHMDNVERKKTTVSYQPNKDRKMIMETTASMNDDSNEGSMSEIVILGSTNGTSCSAATMATTALPSVQANAGFNQFCNKQAALPRQTYLRTNSTNSSNSTRLNSLTVTTVTPVIVRSTGNLAQIQLKRLCSKRGKEEALSNSSSSDEEADQQKKTTTTTTNQSSPPTTSVSSQKLQQLILNTPVTSSSSQSSTQQPLKLTFNKSNNTTTSNLLTVNMLTSSHQPPITPVVSAASSAAAAAASNTTSTSCSSLASSIAIATNGAGVNESIASSFGASVADSEIVTSPSSCASSSSPSFSSSSSSSSASSSPYLKSQKSSIDQDYDSKYTSSFSAASPTSICSSSATNDGAIDLQDDNSSTASGPIYVRQPGFEHHAHEVVAAIGQPTPKIRNFSNLNNNERITRVKKSDSANTLLLGNKATSVNSNMDKKVKKKLCMMTSADNSSELNSGNSLIPDRHNVHLKPLSNKAKREGLPMRLRALPPSFWQQPNQPNPLPGAMYLPPLFKNDLEGGIDDTVGVHFEESAKLLGLETTTSSNALNQRDVKISPANTDLLFKLFENVEQREKRQQQQFLQQRSSLKSKPAKSSQKALVKGGSEVDPCLVDAVSEGLFPLLTLDTRNETVQYLAFKPSETATAASAYASLSSNGLSNSSPMISSTSMVNSLLASTATNSNGLPLLQYEQQNYSQALSEVVAAL